MVKGAAKHKRVHSQCSMQVKSKGKQNWAVVSGLRTVPGSVGGLVRREC
jgi:hypothetical protein